VYIIGLNPDEKNLTRGGIYAPKKKNLTKKEFKTRSKFHGSAGRSWPSPP